MNGVKSSMNTIPMLKICTPPPDMYSMKACIGNDLAGPMAKSHAFFSFNVVYEADAVAIALLDGFAWRKLNRQCHIES